MVLVPPLSPVLDSENVRVGAIRDINVIADCGAVLGRIIIPVDANTAATALRRFHEQRKKVGGFGRVAFSDLVIGIGACGVEVAEADGFELVRLTVPAEGALDEEFESP